MPAVEPLGPVSLSVEVSLIRLWDSVFPPSFPPMGLKFRTPLPSTGSPGVASPVSRVIWESPTPPVRPKRLRLPSTSGTCVGCLIRSIDRSIQPVSGLGPWSSVGLPGGVRRRREALPGSWETPVHACPALRPRWAGFSLPYREKPVLPSRLRKPSAPRDVTFEAPSRGLHARCLRFTVWVAPARRKTRFQPAG
jgi:hypothetical protein